MLSARVWDERHSKIVEYPSVLVTTVGVLVRHDPEFPFDRLIPFGSGRVVEINGEGDELVEAFVQFRPDLVEPLES